MTDHSPAGPPEDLFRDPLDFKSGVYLARGLEAGGKRQQTRDAFSEKWSRYRQDEHDTEAWKRDQFKWYLELYGYASERELADFMATRKTVLDAGCGLGYKAAWLASMNREATVVAMDISDAVFQARERYGNEPNIVFVKGDISSTPFRDGVFDFVSCDQVLHHTENPPSTLVEFRRICRAGAILNAYVYARKALPRELLDEHFREYGKKLGFDGLWRLSEQLTALGRTLSELSVTIDVPDIPALGIRGGRQDLQRFIYWNFLKCFWNPEHGWDGSVACNFDWYAPGNAHRYEAGEFLAMAASAGFVPEFTRSEEACHTGRFRKKCAA